LQSLIKTNLTENSFKKFLKNFVLANKGFIATGSCGIFVLVWQVVKFDRKARCVYNTG